MVEGLSVDGLSMRETNVLREAVWHAVQRGDVPDEDREVLHELYSKFSGGLKSEFKDPTEELHFYLVGAERLTQKALDFLYKPEGAKRSIWFRMAIGRAQNILMSAYVRDLRLGR